MRGDARPPALYTLDGCPNGADSAIPTGKGQTAVCQIRKRSLAADDRRVRALCQALTAFAERERTTVHR